MQKVIDVVLALLLSMVVFQDFKYRHISWFLIPLLFIGFILKGLLAIAPSDFIFYSLFNLGFIIVNMILVTLVISARRRKIVTIINTFIGIGDLLFFMVICSAFSSANFIVFYSLSLFITLMIFLIHNIVSKKATKEIPLAGAMAGLMILLLVVKQFLQLNFYNDYFITSLF